MGTEGGERKRERERWWEREECVCVCVCVNLLTFSCSGVAPVFDALSEPAKSTMLSCVNQRQNSTVACTLVNLVYSYLSSVYSPIGDVCTLNDDSHYEV